jgi:predicted methyltransferase
VPGGQRWGAVSTAFAEVFRVLKPGGVFCLNHQHRSQTIDGTSYRGD